jgi:group I intron endonuclease
MASGIYKITCLENNKFYFGKCSVFRSRKYQHLNDLRKNKHVNNNLQNDYNVFGEEKFKFELIEEATENLNGLEQKYLDLYFDNQVNCYNIKYGSSASKNPEETRKKRSDSSTEMWKDEEYRKRQSEIQSIKMKEYWANNRNKKLNSIHSFHNSDKGKEAHKQASAWMKGRNISDETKVKLANHNAKKYTVIDPQGNKIEIINLKKFCKENNLGYDRMIKLLNNHISHFKGYKSWESVAIVK